jgi:DNA-binding Lrp family transcriptional regulator
MGWRSASQPGASAGHPIEIAARYLAPLRPAFKRTSAIALATPRLVNAARFCWIATTGRGPQEACMVPFFVQIKCQLGKSYEVANRLADAEIASEIYSTAGEFDLLVKFYVEDKVDIGHFVNEQVQMIPGIQDTRTIITFKAF